MKKKRTTQILYIFALLFSTFSTAQEEISQQKKEEWASLIQGGEVQTTDGLFVICPQKKCGCIDSTGRIIVPLKYDFIRGFYNGLAAVNIGGEWKDEEYPEIRGGKWGFVDTTGREVVALKYDYIPAIDHGWFGNLIPVELDDKQGLINQKGKEITAIKYDGIESFDDNLWSVFLMDSVLNSPNDSPNIPKYWHFKKYGLVDKSGEITPVKYSTIYSPFTNGFTKVKVILFNERLNSPATKEGIIDASGKEVIAPIYDHIEETFNEEGFMEYFSEGLAEVELNGRSINVDEFGKQHYDKATKKMMKNISADTIVYDRGNGDGVFKARHKKTKKWGIFWSFYGGL